PARCSRGGAARRPHSRTARGAAHRGDREVSLPANRGVHGQASLGRVAAAAPRGPRRASCGGAMTDAVIQKVEQAIRDFVYDAVFTDTANAEMRKEGYGGRSIDGGKLNDLMNQLKAAARSTSPAK